MAAVVKGILGRKLGMTQAFDDLGRVISVTVVRAGPCRVSQVKTLDSDGYSAVQLAFQPEPERKINSPERGHLSKNGIGPHRNLVELRIPDTSAFTVGQELRADVFAKGEKADVVGVSKGKGFSGVMKRHGFAGLPGSHGTERKHRSPGSIGGCATPGRVFKGMKMAGQLGNRRVTVLGLEVIAADPERGLILLKGAIPGPKDGLVLVRSSVRSQPQPAGA